jgi:hypothetical protein
LGSLAVFVLTHLLLLLALLATAAGAGTLAIGVRGSLALRATLGLAVSAQVLFFLAVAGALRPIPIAAAAIVAIAGGAARGLRFSPRSREVPFALWIAGAGLLVMALLLALFPPLAFDETLYHLPFVRALATSGELSFLPRLRFPVFPQLHELLCVPMLLAGGDVATHLVSLAETLLTALLLFDWGRGRAGLLAAAFFAGSPSVVQLATINYVDAALTLFVAAAFYSLDRARWTDRRWLALAGVFLGTAASVKYLGWFFAAAAVIAVVICSRERLRAAGVLVAGIAAAAAPTTLWLIITTRNPVFPFAANVFGPNAWTLDVTPAFSLTTRITRTLRLAFDVTFVRVRVNQQPPFTPFLIIALVVIAFAALRSVRARVLLAIVAVYAIVFSFLPQDSRYLVPLLPLIAIGAASAIAERWPRQTHWFAAIVFAPGLAYAVYALAIRGLPPATATDREAFLRKRIPEYTALRHATGGVVYVCGGEQLKAYAPAELLGDENGPFSWDRVLPRRGDTRTIAASLRSIGARYFLVAKRACPTPRNDGGMTLAFEDAGAQLWEVQRSQSAP